MAGLESDLAWADRACRETPKSEGGWARTQTPILVESKQLSLSIWEHGFNVHDPEQLDDKVRIETGIYTIRRGIRTTIQVWSHFLLWPELNSGPTSCKPDFVELGSLDCVSPVAYCFSVDCLGPCQYLCPWLCPRPAPYEITLGQSHGHRHRQSISNR